MNNGFIRFKTSSPSGDLISFLSGIRELCSTMSQKAIIYHQLNVEGVSYEGATHPYKNETTGLPVCFNEYAFKMMRPLMLAQDYIEAYIPYTGQEFDFDLDEIRMKVFTNQPKGSLNRWLFYAFPQMTADITIPWIEVPQITAEKKIIINFTKRHRNYGINYFFLKQYVERGGEIVFVGLKDERDFFCQQWGLDIPVLEVGDFSELAMHIKNSRFFMGNQSFCFQLAEAMKVPRILELFPLMPNVIPMGGDCVDFYHQKAVEYHFEQFSIKYSHPQLNTKYSYQLKCG